MFVDNGWMMKVCGDAFSIPMWLNCGPKLPGTYLMCELVFVHSTSMYYVARVLLQDKSQGFAFVVAGAAWV